MPISNIARPGGPPVLSSEAMTAYGFGAAEGARCGKLELCRLKTGVRDPRPTVDREHRKSVPVGTCPEPHTDRPGGGGRQFAMDRRVQPRAFIEFHNGDRGALDLGAWIRGALQHPPRHDRSGAGARNPCQISGSAGRTRVEPGRQQTAAAFATPDHQRCLSSSGGGVTDVSGVFRIALVHRASKSSC